MRIESRDLSELAKLYDQNHFYTKAFKNLLTAITRNDVSSLDKVPDEILYSYVATRDKLAQFFNNEINEPLYESDAYNGLMNMKLDLYAVMHTMINLRKEITNLSIQPDEVVSEYLDSFGFPVKHLFGPQQRRGIAQNVYGYLRKKGTPSLLGRLLNQLNYRDFYIAEYWLHHNYDTARFPDARHTLIPDIIWNNNSALPIETFAPLTYALGEIDDPLWTLSSDDIDEMDADKRLTFPMKTAYYVMGLVFEWSKQGTIFSLLHSAMYRQTTERLMVGEDINEIYVSGFSKNVSYIALTYAYAMVLSHLSGIHDPLSVLPTDKMMWWQGDVSYLEQQDVAFISPKSIYKTIVKEVEQLYMRPSYSPPGHPDNLSPLKRKEKILAAIKQRFYGDVRDNVSRDNLISTFSKHDKTFCAWVKNILDTAGTDSYGVTIRLELLNVFGEAFESFFFDKCHAYIPVRQIILSQTNLINAMRDIDKHFTPYHSHLVTINNIYVINDVPGDCVAYEDKNKLYGEINVFDWWFEPYYNMHNHFVWVDDSDQLVQNNMGILHHKIGNIFYYPFIYNNKKWDIVLVEGLHPLREMIMFNNPYQFSQAPDRQGTIHASMPKDIPIPREFTDIYGDYGIWNTIRWTLGATKMQQDEISLIDQTDLGKHPEEGYIKTSDSQPHADHMLTWVDAILKSNLSISDARGLVEGILSMHERIFKNTERSQTHLESLIEETVILITPYHLLYTDTVTDLIVMNYTGMFGHSTSVYNVPGPSLRLMGSDQQYRYDSPTMWSYYARSMIDVTILDLNDTVVPTDHTTSMSTDLSDQIISHYPDVSDQHIESAYTDTHRDDIDLHDVVALPGDADLLPTYSETCDTAERADTFYDGIPITSAIEDTLESRCTLEYSDDDAQDAFLMNYTGVFGSSTSIYNVPGPSLVSMGPLEQYRYDIAPMWSHYANTRSDVSFLDTVVITEPMIRTPTQTTEMECWHEVLVPAGTPPEHIV